MTTQSVKYRGTLSSQQGHRECEETERKEVRDKSPIEIIETENINNIKEEIIKEKQDF